MASIPEILEKPAAKAVVAVVAVAAIGGVAFELSTSPAFKNNDYGKQVSTSLAASEAQKAIDALRTNTSIPEPVKQQQIQHLQGEIDAANGKAPKAGGPPTTKPGGPS